MAMNVAQLRGFLATMPDDTLIVLSGDGFGNDFSPLDEATVDQYVAENTWSGELTDDKDDGVPAIVLWPVN